MSWQRKKLEDVADFTLGKMLDEKKNKGELLPYLANINVRWGSFDLDELREMKFEEHEKDRFGLKEGDILMCEGGEPGRCAIWKDQNPNMMIQKALHRIRPYEDVDGRFLFYSFLHKGKTGGFAPLFTGSTIKHLPKEKLAKVEVDIPLLQTQQQIASILSAYDDLIENNRRRIQLLEETARLLYKEWFVQLRFPGHEHVKIINGVPEGWIHTPVASILGKVKRKGKVKNEDYLTDGLLACVDQSKEFIGGYIDDQELAIKEELPVVVFGDHTRVVKYVDFPFAPGADGTQILIPNSDEIPRVFFYFLIAGINLANAFYARHFKFLKATEVLIPTKELMRLFDDSISSNMDQISLLREQNKKLAQARDILLPRLMNGELVA